MHWKEGERNYWLHESGIYGVYVDPPYLSHKWIAELERHSDEHLFGRIFEESTEQEIRDKVKVLLSKLVTVEDIEECIKKYIESETPPL